VWRWLPFVALAGIYVIELRLDVIDVDSAQYAHIAREMLATKSFLIVRNRGLDYLDKPPLTFWLAALSYAVLGVSTVAYKLPSLLFGLLGIFSTYRFARIHESERVAYTSALVLASCLAMFLWTNDVRTDTLLMGSVAFTLWQLAAYRRHGGRLNFIAGFVGMGLAMLAKGPVGAMVPVLALGGDALLKRDWRALLHPRWLVGAAIVLAVLAPMSWGLYRQFGWQGLRFFYWTQSFGRITGESTWRDTTTPLFFTHTLLWELLPWTAFFVAGFLAETRQLVKSRFRLMADQEAITWVGFLLPFVAFSLSHYKLPHYIFVLLPLASVVSARQIERALASTRFTAAFVTQGVVVGLIWFVLAWLVLVAFPLTSTAGWLALAVCGVVTLWLARPSARQWTRLVGPSLMSITAFAGMLALHFYPTLLGYQAPTVAARLALSQGIPRDRIFTLNIEPYSFDFTLQRAVPRLPSTEILRVIALQRDAWVLTDEAGAQAIDLSGVPVREKTALVDFPISRLSLLFLRPETRASRLEKLYLVHVGHFAGAAGG
jgi:4-amino-4-deoxy-L-arabinose transferase-like glycosyltransferase